MSTRGMLVQVALGLALVAGSGVEPERSRAQEGYVVVQPKSVQVPSACALMTKALLDWTRDQPNQRGVWSVLVHNQALTRQVIGYARGLLRYYKLPDGGEELSGQARHYMNKSGNPYEGLPWEHPTGKEQDTPLDFAPYSQEPLWNVKLSMLTIGVLKIDPDIMAIKPIHCDDNVLFGHDNDPSGTKTFVLVSFQQAYIPKIGLR
jgi:hypothetical protein